MVLYLSIIIVLLLFLIFINYIFIAPILGFSAGYIVFAVLISFVVEVAIDGFIAFLAHRLPKKCVNPFRKYYLVSKKEKRIYEHLGVKHFKDHLPDLGWLCNFRKAKIKEPKNIEYIYKYMEESCYGEIGHLVSIPFGFLVIFIFPLKYALCFGLPIAIVNIVLNLLPTMALRYNRYKLNIVYKRLEQISCRNNNEIKDNNTLNGVDKK